MIELLIKYIQDKGYTVDVRPRAIIIRKVVQEELISYGWMISKFDLQPELEDYLYWQADVKCQEIEDAIIERFGVQA